MAEMITIGILLACFHGIRPFTTTGSHATVYPQIAPIVFIPGQYDGKKGLWIYDSGGASFAAIDPSLDGKTVGFTLNAKAGHGIIYQPANAVHGPKVWVRNASSQSSGVSILFKNSDDPSKRAPLEAELQAMTQGMATTWDNREEKLVKAVNEGKYLWFDVDIDDYQDAVTQCVRSLGQAPEAQALRGTLQSEAAQLGQRASQTGVVRDVHPSAFMSTPQY